MCRCFQALYRELGSTEEVEASIGGRGSSQWRGREEKIRMLEDQLTSMRSMLASKEAGAGVGGSKPGSRGSDAGAAEANKLEEYR